MRTPVDHHRFHHHKLADDSERPTIVHKYAKEGSQRVEQEPTPTMAPLDREQLGRYAKPQGRGITISKGKPVIEEMPMRDPDSRLLSRDPLP
jgi:hypothetical protein